MRNTKWYAGAMLVVTAILGALILLPRPETAHATSAETCTNGTNLEASSITWFAVQTGMTSCANDPAWPPTHGGSCKSTYGLICQNPPSTLQYRLGVGESCTGDSAHRKIVNNVWYHTAAGQGWTLAPYPNDQMHCTCNAGGSGCTCNWQ